MFLSLMKNFIGQWGLAVLNFYETYSLWINLIVLAYGVWIILSWVNLKNIRKVLVRSLIDQIQLLGEAPKGKAASKSTTSLVIPWENAIGVSRFPYVAQQTGLVPQRVSLKSIQSLLPVEDMVLEARQILKKRAKKKG